MRRYDSVTDGNGLPTNHTNPGARGFQNALDVKVLGVCSGSGLDQIDCALVQYHQASPNTALCLEVLTYGSIPTPAEVHNHILAAFRDAQRNPLAVTCLNALLSDMVSSGIKTFCKKRAIPIESIDLVGTHISGLGRFGHPEKDTQSFHPLGWNARIAVETGISTVFDFIVMEGGLAKLQTSPVAFVDRLLLSHASKFRACLNIGELTSLSFVLPLTDEDGPKTTMSYDCGPGSLLIDYAMRYCSANIRGQDNNGKFAASGEVNQAIVTRFLLGNNYSRTSPSLRIAREMFGNHEGQRLIDECIYTNLSEPDIAATVTRITAENILTQYQRILNFAFPSGQKIDELFISGPCARNENLIDYLEAELPESVVTKPMDDIGIPGDANEAVCYAHLALETVLERTTRSSSSPGALESDGVRGSIVWGKNWSHVSDRIHRFSNGKSLHLTKNVRVAGSLEPEFRGLSGW